MKLKNKPIDVIARFRVQDSGIPNPYKFRYKDERGNAFDVRVERIFNIQDNHFAGRRSFIYRCASVIAGKEMMYELRYLVDDCKWELYKI